VRRANRRLEGLPIYYKDLARADTARIEQVAMENIRRHGVRLIILDHLQFVLPVGRYRDRFEKIAMAADQLKHVCKRTNVPWIILAHISRDAFKGREDKRPQMSDLFGASEIEKMADVVIMIHREEYWLRQREPEKIDGHDQGLKTERRQEWELKLEKHVNIAEFLQRKRRRGAPGLMREAFYDGEKTTFYDLIRRVDGCREPEPMD
jgi:replicative DNA helicase